MESLFFIAIVVPEEIDQQIVEIKKHIFLNYKSKASLRSPGHITLHMPFRWSIEKEDILNSKLVEFSKNKEPFWLKLNGFNAFAPRVIFIDVEENEKLKDLQKQLVQFSRTDLKIFNGNYKEKPFHPHVTVAFRDLKKQLFYPAFEEFSDKEFNYSFFVNHIALLRHNGKEWKVDNIFKF